MLNRNELDENAMKAFEHYLINGKNLDLSLKSLVPGSEAYTFLYLMHHLRDPKGLDKVKKEFDDLLDPFPKTWKKIFELRKKMLEYEKADSKKKKQIIQDLGTTYFSIKHNFTKPATLKKIQMEKDAVGAEDDGESEIKNISQSQQKKKVVKNFETRFFQEYTFKKQPVRFSF
jgi:hypothetical protein